MARIDYWALIPAAGVGSRLGAEIPKQYLALAGRPIIEHTVARFSAHARIAGTVVVLAPGDEWWAAVGARLGGRLIRAAGGAERCHSVRNGLEVLSEVARPDDRVLVHDAVRPCIGAADIDKLIDAVGETEDGGLLGLPVRDTIKRTGAEGIVCKTVARDGLWHALTPQLFPIASLRAALGRCMDAAQMVTDEAQAMEHWGARPRMVAGWPGNIKITRREDLRLAELLLRHREEER